MKKYLFSITLLLLIIVMVWIILYQLKPVERVIEADLTEGIEISTLIGEGVIEYSEDSKDDFFHPTSVIHDADGNLLISDNHHHTISLVGDDANVEVIAGHSSELNEFNLPIGGNKDGDVEEAQFNFPSGLIIDAENNIYVADSGNGEIRKISASGKVETMVEGLQYPFDLAMNEEGVIFFSDALSHQIYELQSDGTLAVFAGGGYVEEDGYLVGNYADGNGESAKFNEPSGIAFTPSGDLLVADSGNQRIRKINIKGEVTTIAGSGDSFIPGTTYMNGGYEDGVALEAKFNFPKSINAINDEMYIVADTYNHVLRLIHDGEVTTFAGDGYAGISDGNQSTAQFYNPYDLSFKDNQLIVVDQYSQAIREIELNKNIE